MHEAASMDKINPSASKKVNDTVQVDEVEAGDEDAAKRTLVTSLNLSLGVEKGTIVPVSTNAVERVGMEDSNVRIESSDVSTQASQGSFSHSKSTCSYVRFKSKGHRGFTY
jgi:hypothetical protein